MATVAIRFPEESIPDVVRVVRAGLPSLGLEDRELLEEECRDLEEYWADPHGRDAAPTVPAEDVWRRPGVAGTGCARCGTVLPAGEAAVLHGGTWSCLPCDESLHERLGLVREGWYSAPLGSEEVIGYALRARAAAERGDGDGWIEAMADYCRAVIYRERDDPPEHCLANYMWGIVWMTTREGMQEAFARAAAEFDGMAGRGGGSESGARTFGLAADLLRRLADGVGAEIREAAARAEAATRGERDEGSGTA